MAGSVTLLVAQWEARTGAWLNRRGHSRQGLQWVRWVVGGGKGPWHSSLSGFGFDQGSGLSAGTNGRGGMEAAYL